MNGNTKKGLIIVIALIVIAALAWILFGKGNGLMWKTAQQGDTVRVDYVGTFEDGTVFDTSLEQVAKDNALFSPQRSYAPLEFTIGGGQMIQGFDDAIVGMKEGESKTVTLLPDQAYGEIREDLIVAVSGTEFSQSGITPEVGQTYQTSQGSYATVKAVEGDNVIMDYNSPMAGKTLTFEITLKEIVAK